MAAYEVRQFGDPVLRQVAAEVTNVDGRLVQLTQAMVPTMQEAGGLGLAAPQIGVQKRLFVYDLRDGEGVKVLINPVISEHRGEWTYDEGCLSVKGLSWDIVRPKEIHITGFDLEGNEINIEADELMARLFQHELDHLDGKLLIDYLDAEQRADAMKTLRGRLLATPQAAPPPSSSAMLQVKTGIAGLTLPGRR